MLQNLTLQNFRNYSRRKFDLPVGKAGFSPNATLIVGPNAIGKTNILEAIYLLATGRSFRAELEKEVIKDYPTTGLPSTDYRTKSVARIFGETDKNELEIIWDGRERFSKTYKVNGVGKRQVDFVGNLRAVLFSPLDLEIVIDSPSVRRKYLDLVLTQTSKEYRLAVHVYERALKQRNRILKWAREQGLGPRQIREQLDYWNNLLINNGKIIHIKRKEYLDFLSEFQHSIFNVQLHYDHSIISEERLAKYESEEIGAATTLVGPHRDDFSIHNVSITNKKEHVRDVRLFGSRGEQRMAVFEMKLGELAYIKEITGENPILLLDDIFSELDHSNRHLLLKVIPKQQTIMTTTDLHLVEKEYLKHVELVELTG